jgi:hypothetical protein
VGLQAGMGERLEGGFHLCYSGPLLVGTSQEEEVTQWVHRFMLQNCDFPFQPSDPGHLSQQDPGVRKGLEQEDIKDTELASYLLSLTSFFLEP